MKAAIVIPSIREASVRASLAAWEPEFKGHHVIVVEDNPAKTFTLPHWAKHYSWAEIDASLGKDAWIIPRRSGAIRNYGILAAKALNPDMVVMLDDDCLPDPPSSTGPGWFLGAHWDALNVPGTAEPFYNTLSVPGYGVNPRGFPKEFRSIKTVVNHGLWNNIPDLDGETQLKFPALRTRIHPHSVQVPRGVMFPLSAMNVAFRPEALPAMYQIPMGQGTPFHRFDDIWCGWIMKKACDASGLSVRSGSPAIWHSRASDATKNAEQEAPGIIENEKVWRAVAGMSLSAGTLTECLEEVHSGLEPLGPYWEKVSEASAIWRRLTA